MKKIVLGAGVAIVVVIVGVVWQGKMTSVKPQQMAPTPVPTEVPVTARLEIFTKPVTVVLPGTSDQTEALDQQEIAAGTKVMTGETGRAQLVYGNHSVTRMDVNTEITLKKLTAKPQQVEILLGKKRIWNRVAKLLGQESYQTETATTVASVRGTSYAHGILPDGRNRVIATKGTVESKCLNDSQQATVTANAKELFDCKTGGKLPLLKLDEVVKDKDEWFDFNVVQDKALDDRFGKDTYGDE